MSSAIAGFICGVGQLLLKGWLLMLALGWLHESYVEVPPLGFGISLGVVFVAGLLFSWPELDLSA